MMKAVLGWMAVCGQQIFFIATINLWWVYFPIQCKSIQCNPIHLWHSKGFQFHDAFLQLNSIYEARVSYSSNQGKEPAEESSKLLDGGNTVDNDGNTVDNHEVAHHLFLTLLNPEPLLAQVLHDYWFNPPLLVNTCSYSDSAPLWLLAKLSWCLRPCGCLWGFHSAHQSIKASKFDMCRIFVSQNQDLCQLSCFSHLYICPGYGRVFEGLCGILLENQSRTGTFSDQVPETTLKPNALNTTSYRLAKLLTKNELGLSFYLTDWAPENFAVATDSMKVSHTSTPHKTKTS